MKRLTIIIALLVMPTMLNAQVPIFEGQSTPVENYTYIFAGAGYSDVSNVLQQSGKMGRTGYIGGGRTIGENTRWFATGGYVENGLGSTIDTAKVSTGEIVGGVAWLPINIPEQNPVVKLGFLAELGAGFFNITTDNDWLTTLAVGAGVMGEYVIARNEVSKKPVGYLQTALRAKDCGKYDKFEALVLVRWELAK